MTEFIKTNKIVEERLQLLKDMQSNLIQDYNPEVNHPKAIDSKINLLIIQEHIELVHQWTMDYDKYKSIQNKEPIDNVLYLIYLNHFYTWDLKHIMLNNDPKQLIILSNKVEYLCGQFTFRINTLDLDVQKDLRSRIHFLKMENKSLREALSIHCPIM